jgi:hypothetical protein
MKRLKPRIRIARATKKVCAKDGMGHQVVVWRDLTCSEALNSNDLTGRDTPTGIEPPLVRITRPMTIAQVGEVIAREMLLLLRNINYSRL